MRVRLSGNLSDFPFSDILSSGIFQGFDLVYTAEIRGQPLVLLYKMIVCAGWSEKAAGPICKILFGSYRFGYEICQKNTKFYIS